MKCDQLTRTKYALVMGTIIRRRNEDLIAINSGARSRTRHQMHAWQAFLRSTVVSLPFARSAAIHCARYRVPHVKYARSDTNGFRQYRTKKREGFCWRGLLRFASMGRCPGRCPTGATADEYGQSGLSRTSVVSRPLHSRSRSPVKWRWLPKDLPTNLKFGTCRQWR